MNRALTRCGSTLLILLLLVLGPGCQDNPVEADKEPPTVRITSPSANANVTGEVIISASASDNKGVERVAFYLDDEVLGTKSQAPWTHSWDARATAEGAHVLYAKAYDADENEGTSDPVVVTVGQRDGDDGSGDDGSGDDGSGDDGSGDDGSGSSGTTVIVHNQLATAINVYVNGTVIGSVPAGETAQKDVGDLDQLDLGWSVVKIETDDGTPIGDDMGGTFETITDPASTTRFTIDHIVGEQWYFFPLMTNQTGVGLLMAVNWALEAENRCNCVVPPNKENVRIGYYRLYSNTRVVAFREGSGYTGGYRYWEYGTQFTSDNILSGTGTLQLTANTAPSKAAISSYPEETAQGVRKPSLRPPGWLGNDQPADLPRRVAAPMLPAAR